MPLLQMDFQIAPFPIIIIFLLSRIGTKCVYQYTNCTKHNICSYPISLTSDESTRVFVLNSTVLTVELQTEGRWLNKAGVFLFHNYLPT